MNKNGQSPRKSSKAPAFVIRAERAFRLPDIGRLQPELGLLGDFVRPRGGGKRQEDRAERESPHREGPLDRIR